MTKYADMNNWQRIGWMLKHRRFWILCWKVRDWDIYLQTYSCKFFKWPFFQTGLRPSHLHIRLFYFGLEAFK